LCQPGIDAAIFQGFGEITQLPPMVVVCADTLVSFSEKIKAKAQVNTHELPAHLMGTRLAIYPVTHLLQRKIED
jgi:predicted house-cleaning NTP pyrophosphatase (Maf/HAM1 superfamily)